MLRKDKPNIKVKGGLIEINHGKRFPAKKSYALYSFLIVAMGASLFLPFSTLLVSFITIFSLLIIFMYTATTGYLIDSKERMKFYMRAFGIDLGSWKVFKHFSCLVMKTTTKKRENAIVNIIGDGASVTERFKTTEVYLMNSSHRKKILCGSFESYEEAKKFAKELSNVLNYPIQKFSPKRIQRKR